MLPSKETELRQVNFLYSGESAGEIATACRIALNQIARDRGVDMYARVIFGIQQIRYAAREAWEYKGPYRSTVVIGINAFNALDEDVKGVLISHPDVGNLLEAVGATFNDTKTRALWRLITICNRLGFTQAERNKVHQIYADRVGLDPNNSGTPRLWDDPVVPSNPFTKLLQNSVWLVGPVNGKQPYMTTGYNVILGSGNYKFGCNNDSRHKGVDVGMWNGFGDEQSLGAPIYSWGRGYVRLNAYNDGGYHRYIGVYYPDVKKSVDLGHLLNGSVQVKVGEWFEPGQLLAKIGTAADGLTYSHLHIRSGNGDFGRNSIGPCNDEDPVIAWRALGLPG